MVSASSRRLTILFLCAVLNSLHGGAVSGQEGAASVTVRLQHGRSMKGFVDEGSNDTHLLLRRTSPQVILRTQLPWTAVASVKFNGQELTAEELKQRLPELSSSGPRSLFPDSSSNVLVHRSQENGVTAVAHDRPAVVTIVPESQPSGQSAAAFKTAARSRVRSLQLITQLANWDNDAAIDGLVVRIQPLNDVGGVVAVDGRLSLKLVSLTETQGGQVQFGRSPVEFPELETWDQPVRRSDFTTDGAVYRLEFRRFDAERDIAVIPVGMVSARLSVPSVGTFAATENVTLLRPYSLIRDVHQQFRGTRQLPGEFKD